MRLPEKPLKYGNVFVFALDTIGDVRLPAWVRKAVSMSPIIIISTLLVFILGLLILHSVTAAKIKRYDDELRRIEVRNDVLSKKNLALERRYEPIITDQARMSQIKDDIENLRRQMITAKDTMKAKSSQMKALEERMVSLSDEAFLFDVGVHPVRFDLQDTKTYRAKIEEVRAEMKSLIKTNQALISGKDPVKPKGPQITALRAFNQECEAAMSEVKWNNLGVKESQIKREAERIAKEFKSTNTFISDAYLDLRISELHLVHAQAEKEKDEKEAARAGRENKKAQSEAAAALKKAKRAEADEASAQS